MNSIETHDYWLARERETFIAARMEHEKISRGTAPTKAVASRWFNLMTTIAETFGDESLPDAPAFELGVAPSGRSPKPVYVCHKPC
jgi:hypothetical protein